MTDENEKPWSYAVRGGMSGILKNGVVFGSDAASCLRRALLRHHKIEEPISPKSRKVFAIGALNEELFEQSLIKAGISYIKERELSERLSEDTVFSGHSDYVTTEGDKTIVYELKSITSKNSYKKIMKDGNYKLSNLAQCLNYMAAVETRYGRLVYTSYIEAVEYSKIDFIGLPDIYDAINNIIPENRVFEIFIEDDGTVSVDGNRTDYNIADVLEHRRASANVLEKQLVFSDRPQSHEIGGDVCGWCPFKNVCNNLESDTTTEEFLTNCKGAIDEQV